MSLVALPLLVATQFVTLHNLKGQEVYVNPQQITTLREPQSAVDLGHLPPGTHCVVFTTSGKFLAVQEYCAEVEKRIEQLR